MMRQVSAERPVPARESHCALPRPGEALWLVLCAGILAWKLLLPGFIGIADNGDFGKVAGSLCLASAEPEPENFFHPLYLRAKSNCYYAHIPTSEIALAWLASTLEQTVGDRSRFDIRWLGATHSLIFLAFYYAVLMLLRPLSGITRFTLSLLALWIFADIGLLAYFNSFYTDAAAALGGLATAFFGANLLAARRPAPWQAVLFGLAALLLITSKAQHGVFGAVPASLAFLIGRRASSRRMRTAADLVGLALLAATAAIVAATPHWYKSQARFNLIFSKLVKNSPSPARDLAELGLGAEDARYIGMDSYTRDGPMSSATWVDSFGTRCTYGDVLKFYLRHPARALAILRADLARQAWQRRVPGLSNFARQSGRPEGATADSLGSWSALRTSAARKWPALNVIWLALFPPAAFWLASRDGPLCKSLAWTVLPVSVVALGEFGVASLADAVETPRHLLLFHVYSDVSIFLGLLCVATLLEAACPVSFRKPLFVLVAAGLTMFVTSIVKYEILAAAVPPAPSKDRGDLPATAADDTSPEVVYVGKWSAGAFGSAFRGTLTYSDAPGATARFSFTGTGLLYAYTRAPNRGMALVTIDGNVNRTIDLYDPQPVWQARTLFGGLKAGPHHAEIQVLGRHNPASSGDFVDIDALAGR
jgi:hypothetical protein